MSSIAEFIKIREHIEALATKITLLAERKAATESKQRLDEANKHLDTLKTMVANDVQVIVVERLTRQLTRLGAKVDTMLAKKPVKKELKAAV
jgi:Tfp pilus assembly protein PilO